MGQIEDHKVASAKKEKREEWSGFHVSSGKFMTLSAFNLHWRAKDPENFT